MRNIFYILSLFIIVILVSCQKPVSEAQNNQNNQSRITITLHHAPLSQPIRLVSYVNGRVKTVHETLTDKSSFSYTLPTPILKGEYRLYLDQERYIEFLIEDEVMNVAMDFLQPESTLSYDQSPHNQIYRAFLSQKNETENRLRLLTPIIDQYPSNTTFYQKATEEYQTIQKDFHSYIDKIGQDYPGTVLATLAHNQKIPAIPPDLNGNQRESFLQENYWAHTDFGDSLLLNSFLINNRVIEYLSLFRNPSLSKEAQDQTFVRAVGKLMALTEPYPSMYQRVVGYMAEGFEGYEYTQSLTYIADHYLESEACTDGTDESVLLKKLEQYKYLAVGEKIPDLRIQDQAGRIIDIKNSDKPFTLLVFWSSDCPHCRDILPEIGEVTGKYKDKLDLITVSVDNDIQAWSAYLSNHDISGIHSCDGKGWNSPAAQKFMLYATPTMFLYGKNETILLRPMYVNDVKEFIANQ